MGHGRLLSVLGDRNARDGHASCRVRAGPPSGSDRPFASSAAGLPGQAQRRQIDAILQEWERAREEQRQTAEQDRCRADAQQRIAQALTEAESAYTAREYEKAVASFERARSLARADADLNPTFDEIRCRERIAQSLAMQALDAGRQGRLAEAVALYDRALAETSDEVLRRECQSELNTARTQLADQQTFLQAVYAALCGARRDAARLAAPGRRRLARRLFRWWAKPRLGERLRIL